MHPRSLLPSAKYLGLVLLIVFCFGTLALANPITISFPSAGSPRNYGGVLTVDGYVFTSTNHNSSLYAFASWGSGSSDYSGEPMLYLNAPPDTVTMTATDSSLFSVVSMDFAKVFLHSSNATVTLTGTYANSTTTSFSFSMTTPFIYSEILPSSFQDLKSLSWNQGPGYNQFGNIVVIPVPASNPDTPVSESSTIVLVGYGFAGLAAVLRRMS